MLNRIPFWLRSAYKLKATWLVPQQWKYYSHVQIGWIGKKWRGILHSGEMPFSLFSRLVFEILRDITVGIFHSPCQQNLTQILDVQMFNQCRWNAIMRTYNFQSWLRLWFRSVLCMMTQLVNEYIWMSIGMNVSWILTDARWHLWCTTFSKLSSQMADIFTDMWRNWKEIFNRHTVKQVNTYKLIYEISFSSPPALKWPFTGTLRTFVVQTIALVENQTKYLKMPSSRHTPNQQWIVLIFPV